MTTYASFLVDKLCRVDRVAKWVLLDIRCPDNPLTFSQIGRKSKCQVEIRFGGPAGMLVGGSAGGAAPAWMAGTIPL